VQALWEVSDNINPVKTTAESFFDRAEHFFTHTLNYFTMNSLMLLFYISHYFRNILVGRYLSKFNTKQWRSVKKFKYLKLFFSLISILAFLICRNFCNFYCSYQETIVSCYPVFLCQLIYRVTWQKNDNKCSG
jgi:hypothetical protein